MVAVEEMCIPVFNTRSIGPVSISPINAVKSSLCEENAAILITIGDPPLNPGLAGMSIVTTAGRSDVANRINMGWSTTCPEVTSGGANQNSVLVCAWENKEYNKTERNRKSCFGDIIVLINCWLYIIM